MGIITYLFHRSKELSEQKFNLFFLDMGENIHFHYRDLRIELSVGEFIELASLFDKYKQGVLKEIENGYQDGVLPNTNEAHTIKTFWDKDKKLVNQVKYNRRQISLEETRDGYHVHLRNYKILLDKQSFTKLAKAMAEALPALRDENLVRDPLQLLKDNDLQPELISRHAAGNREETRIGVERRFFGKAAKVIEALGYVLAVSYKDSKVYKHDKSNAKVILCFKDRGAGAAYPPVRESLPLVDFIHQFGRSLERDALNQLKLKVLYLFEMAEKATLPPFSLEDVYVNRQSLTPSVDIFAERQGLEPKKEFSRFNSILIKDKLFFIKPKKTIFDEEHQERLRAAFMDWLIDNLVPQQCVARIYALGSTAGMKAGRYSVPFVHFDWIKLNSDFDIFVEIDPLHEDALPAQWKRKFPYAHTGSVYYHFGDVGNGMASEYAKKYPGVTFYEHLVEGYVFFPSSGNEAVKNEFLSKLKTRLIYERKIA